MVLEYKTMKDKEKEIVISYIEEAFKNIRDAVRFCYQQNNQELNDELYKALHCINNSANIIKKYKTFDVVRKENYCDRRTIE